MRLLDGVRRMIGAEKSTLTRAEQLHARPIRNPAIAWEHGVDKNAGLALLKIPRKKGRIANLMAKWMRLPEFRRLELDEIGTDVWELCDGEHSIEQVTGEIVAKYKLNRRQAETSVLAYLRMLAERRLVALRAGSSEPVRKPTQAARKRKRA